MCEVKDADDEVDELDEGRTAIADRGNLSKVAEDGGDGGRIDARAGVVGVRRVGANPPLIVANLARVGDHRSRPSPPRPSPNVVAVVDVDEDSLVEPIVGREVDRP